MKLPIIRKLYQAAPAEKLQATVDVLEAFCEMNVKDEELDVAGELITNLCGAIEVHELVKSGMRESDALNTFSKKVLGSIDR
ncbi:hypothetical protein [Niabella sp.]|uniref:DUF6952 family protein n=1 Tax=Niabella sp. TaxID=1962976 RepID=UPI002610715A|nr:hypothetical protein [Niabella sp.]